MATAGALYKGRIGDPEAKPHVMLLPFASGTAIEPGELLHLDTTFKSQNADESVDAGVAVSIHRITTSHAAGYYPAIVPRKDDLFEISLDAAASAARGTDLYWSSSQLLTATTGSNILGNVYDHAGYPQQQGNADVGDVADRGTTVRNVDKVLFCFEESVSYLAALQKG